MKFLENCEPIYSSDIWYDLTYGGYIKPENILESDDAKKVNDAIELILEFVKEAEAKEILIEN